MRSTFILGENVKQLGDFTDLKFQKDPVTDDQLLQFFVENL